MARQKAKGVATSVPKTTPALRPTRASTKPQVTPCTNSKAKAPIRRNRLGKGQNTLPRAESELHGHLTFTRAAERKRYEMVRNKDIIPCKYIHYPTMETLAIKDEILALVDNIGWTSFFELNCPAYVELTREFYTTYEFNKPSDFTLNSPGVVKFRLMGKYFALSITEFNIALGFITEEYAHSQEYLASSCDFDNNFEACTLYTEWTGLPRSVGYDPSKSPDYYLKNPALKYIHRFLAFSFSGRKNSAKTLTKAEFYFLWCMVNKIKVNLGCWIASQFASVTNGSKNKHPLILGSIITHLAVHAHLLELDDNNLTVACAMQPLDLTCLDVMGLIGKKDGAFYFCPAGPLLSRKDRFPDDVNSSSVPVAPSPSDEPTLQGISERLARIETILLGLCDHIGFRPSSQVSPSQSHASDSF